MEEKMRKHFGLVVVGLNIVGVFAFLGLFTFLGITKAGYYDTDNLTHDFFRSLICGIFPLIYPIYKYIKYRKSA